ncbi:MAG: PfkB family carbohydrate kinase [Candidatus Glassbacteria bacterium]
MSVLVVGSIALDSVQTPAGVVENEPGGSALFASLAASFFTDVSIVATVGTDFPEAVLKRLNERRIDTRGITVEEGETFKWCGVYEENLNKRRSIFTELGVFERFSPHLPGPYRASPHVFLANIDPDLQKDVLRQVNSPRMSLCDTMNFWISGKRETLLELLKEINVLLINEEESLEFSGESSVLKAGRWLLERGPGNIVIKKGEHGAILFGQSEIFAVPSFPVYDVVDPTGAGDTFAGAMIGYLSQFERPGFNELKRSMVEGTVLASFCIEGFGARKILALSKEELEERTGYFLRMIRV